MFSNMYDTHILLDMSIYHMCAFYIYDVLAFLYRCTILLYVVLHTTCGGHIIYKLYVSLCMLHINMYLLYILLYIYHSMYLPCMFTLYSILFIILSYKYTQIP